LLIVGAQAGATVTLQTITPGHRTFVVNGMPHAKSSFADGRLVNGKPMTLLVLESYVQGNAGRALLGRWPDEPFDNYVDHCKTFGFNTLQFYISWDAFEQTKDCWDFTELARMIDLAAANDMRLEVKVNTISKSRSFAPEYVQEDTSTYARVRLADGTETYAQCFNDPDFQRRSKIIYEQMAAFIRHYDVHGVVAIFPNNGEPAIQPLREDTISNNHCHCPICGDGDGPGLYYDWRTARGKPDTPETGQEFSCYVMREALEGYARIIKDAIPTLTASVPILGRDGVGSPGKDPAAFFGRPDSCIDVLSTNLYWGRKDPVAQRQAPPFYHYLNILGNTCYVSESSAFNATWRTIFGTHDGKPNGEFWGGSLGRAYNIAGVTVWQLYGRGQPKPLWPLQGSLIDYWGEMEWTEEAYRHMNSLRAVKAAGSWLPELQGTADMVTFVPDYDPPDEIEPVTISDGAGTAVVGDVTIRLSNVIDDNRGFLLRIGPSDFLFVGVGYSAGLRVDTRPWGRMAVERGSFNYFDWTKSADPLPDTVVIEPHTGYVTLKMSDENLTEKTLENYQYILRVYDSSNVQDADAVAGEGKVELSWTNPEGIQSVLVKRKAGSFPTSPTDGDTVFEGTGTAFVDTNVKNGTSYYYSIFARDASGYSKAVSTAQCAATPADMAPSYVTGFRATDSGDGHTVLTWTNPSDNGYLLTKVVRNKSTDPQVPPFAIDYTAFPNDPAYGEVVYSGTGARCVDSDLENGTYHYYTAFAIDETSNYSAPVKPAQDVAKVGVLTELLAPAAVTVTSGDIRFGDRASLAHDDGKRLVIESESTNEGCVLDVTVTVRIPDSIDVKKIVKLVPKFHGQNTWNAAKGACALNIRNQKTGEMVCLFEGAFCDGQDIDRVLPLYDSLGDYINGSTREMQLNIYQNAPAPENPMTRIDLWGVEAEYLK